MTLAGVEPTSGFHPLWCAVLVPMAGLARLSPELFVRAALTLQLGMVAIGVWRLGFVVPRAVPIFASCALVFWFTKIFLNGLESGLELLLLACAIETAERPRRVVLLGMLCGLLTLTRLSAVVGAATLLGVALWRARPAPAVVARSTLAFALPVIGYPFWLYFRFGHFVPVSGAIKYGHFEPRWSWALPVCVAAVAWAIRQERREAAAPRWRLPLVAWIAFQLMCDASLRRIVVPEIWYLVPHATLFVLAASALPLRVLRASAVGVGLLALATWIVRARPATYSFYVEARDAGEWLARNTPKDARVAGWDSGIESFYSERIFYNLDGLASSWEYKTEYLDEDRTAAFLDDRNIDYVAQAIADEPEPVAALGLDPARWEIIRDVPFAFRGVLERASTRERYLILRRR